MVIILVLWAVAVLSLLAAGLCFALRQNLAVSNIENDRIIAHQLARAGVERAIASIMDDARATDSPADLWYDDPSVFQDIKLTGGTFTVTHYGYDDPPTVQFGVGDESAKLNVNIATRDQMMKLPDMTSPIASAIIDWRDPDEQPEPDGIERGYYAGLAHPYVIRNGPLRTIRELLGVKGIGARLLLGQDADPNDIQNSTESYGSLAHGWFPYMTVYSYEKNVNADGQKRLNLKTADSGTISRRLNLESWAADAIVKARDKNQIKRLVDLLDVRKDTSGSSQTTAGQDTRVRGDSEKDQPVTLSIFKSILDDITLKNAEVLPGLINVNTAPLIVVKTLPGLDDELAGVIVRHREGNKKGFSSIGDLLDISGMTKDKFGQMEDCVTVRSNVFRIKSQGNASSGLAIATIECIVDRNGDVPKILYWLESSP